MIKDKRKIKEIYNCVNIISDEELYPLQKWYNQLINKSINEITIVDVLKMFRQKIFSELAMLKAIEFLEENVFIGELYDGELLEKISELDTTFLSSYVSDLKKILENALKKNTLHTWSYDEEEEEFKEIVELILAKIV